MSDYELACAGNFKANGKSGANETKFSGKVGKRKLKRGSYVIDAVATDAAGGKSTVQKASFTIVKP